MTPRWPAGGPFPTSRRARARDRALAHFAAHEAACLDDPARRARIPSVTPALLIGARDPYRSAHGEDDSASLAGRDEAVRSAVVPYGEPTLAPAEREGDRSVQLAAWNINSIRARKERLLAWIDERKPDVLCLQETKVVDAEFPAAELEARGYASVAHGQKTYNGVAIVSRTPLGDVRRGFEDGGDDSQCRLLTAVTAGVRVASVYVPNGGELGSDKLAFKLAWLGRLGAWLERTARPDEPLVLAGDFNVAPRECDVAYPDAWRETVLFHDSVRAALAPVVDWGLRDLFAEKHPDGGVYSWWDYRQLAFPRGDGLRIDLVLATAPVAARCTRAWVDRDARKGKQPSDHAPVLVELAG